MSNTTSLYSTTSSGNVTVPANNNTGLYNATGVPQTVDNNISITGNITAAGYISAGGNVYGANLVTTGNVYAGNIIGNVIGNLIVPGGSNQVIFNTAGTANASPALTFDPAANALTVGGTISAVGLIATAGNIAGAYILGDGSQLTNLPVQPGTYGDANVTSLLANFGSNTVSTTGNVTVGYVIGDGSLLTNLPIQPGTYSNANVAAYLPTYTGNITANVISATGNITGSYLFGNGSQITGLPAGYSNADVNAHLANFGSNTISTTGTITSGNVQAGNLRTTGLVSATGNVSGGNLISSGSIQATTGIQTGGNVSASNFTTPGTVNATSLTGTIISANGNITGANLFTGGTVSATGTITGGNITTVGLVSATGTITGGNITTAGVISATGNITGNYFIGNGSQLTGLPENYSNANVAAFLPVYTGDYAGANISVTGNVIGNILKTSGVTGNIVGANYVSANFYLGDGGLLSNITSSYGNAQVATLLSAFGSNTISSTGTITTTANIQGGNLLTTGIISATGNITGDYILGNGSQLTGLPATYSNANVATFMAAFGSNTISTTGNVSVGNLILPSFSRITGDWGNGTNASRTAVQAVGNTFTTLNIIPGPGYTPPTAFVTQSSVQTYSSTDMGNSQAMRMSITQTSGRLATASTGTGTVPPMELLINTTTGIYLANGVGNLAFVGIGNTAPNDRLSVLGNAFVSANITAGGNLSLTGNIVDSGEMWINTSSNGNINLNPNGTGQVNIPAGNLIVTGNITGGNIRTAGVVSATGNITGSYILGNGSQLTGITSTTSDILNPFLLMGA